MASTPTPPILAPDNPYGPPTQGGQGSPFWNQIHPYDSYGPQDFQGLLSRYGLGISGRDPSSGALTFTGPHGGSYTNGGASHEGAGPGGESQFLIGQGFTPGSYAKNLAPNEQYGGQVGDLDKLMAAANQASIHSASANPSPQAQANFSQGKDIFGNSAFGVSGGDAVSPNWNPNTHKIDPGWQTRQTGPQANSTLAGNPKTSAVNR